jgi:hypothetical protein
MALAFYVANLSAANRLSPHAVKSLMLFIRHLELQWLEIQWFIVVNLGLKLSLTLTLRPGGCSAK